MAPCSSSFWEGKKAMRYALILTLVATLVCVGCEKPKGPDAAAGAPPGPTAGRPLPSAEPLGPDGLPEGEPAHVTRPPTVTRPEPLVAPGPVTPPAPTAGAEGAPGGIYTIQKGDTLWKIADEMYGDGKKWKNIYRFNKDKIKDPNRLKAGLKLVIPIE